MKHKTSLLILLFASIVFSKDLYLNPSIGINSVYGANGALSLILNDAFTFDLRGGNKAASIGLGGGLYAMPYYAIGGGGSLSYIRSYEKIDDTFHTLNGVALNGIFIFAIAQVDLGVVYYADTEKPVRLSAGISLNFWWVFE